MKPTCDVGILDFEMDPLSFTDRRTSASPPMRAAVDVQIVGDGSASYATPGFGAGVDPQGKDFSTSHAKAGVDVVHARPAGAAAAAELAPSLPAGEPLSVSAHAPMRKRPTLLAVGGKLVLRYPSGENDGASSAAHVNEGVASPPSPAILMTRAMRPTSELSRPQPRTAAHKPRFSRRAIASLKAQAGPANEKGVSPAVPDDVVLDVLPRASKKGKGKARPAEKQVPDVQGKPRWLAEFDDAGPASFFGMPIRRWDIVPTQIEWEAYQLSLPAAQRYATSDMSALCTPSSSRGVHESESE